MIIKVYDMDETCKNGVTNPRNIYVNKGHIIRTDNDFNSYIIKGDFYLVHLTDGSNLLIDKKEHSRLLKVLK